MVPACGPATCQTCFGTLGLLASNLAYDWRTSASLVSTNWLYLVMLQGIWSSVVPLARTLAHKKQNFCPLPPLLLQTCFWAAPSANSLEKVKWSLISWPSGPFNKKASGWMNHLMAKNASKQSSGDLANTSFHS